MEVVRNAWHNQFRYDFYRGIWLTVTNLEFLHTPSDSQTWVDKWYNAGQALLQTLNCPNKNLITSFVS